MVPDDLLQPSPHDFSKAHLVFFSQPFGLAEKSVGDLNLRFYHDGKLPAGGLVFKAACAVLLRELMLSTGGVLGLPPTLASHPMGRLPMIDIPSQLRIIAARHVDNQDSGRTRLRCKLACWF